RWQNPANACARPPKYARMVGAFWCGSLRNSSSRPSSPITSRVEGWMVSPRKSRRKSPCFSSTTTSTPARASRKPSMSPHGPPPTMQQRVESRSAAMAALREFDDGNGPCVPDTRPTSGAQASNPHHPFGDHITGEQQGAEGDDHDRGADLDPAHRQHPVAGARVGEVLGPGPGADGDGGNHGNRDGGPDPHDEGRGDARPEQSLRQREDQHQDRPRARPQADSDDRGKPPLPSARAGKLLRLGCMRVLPRGRLFVVCVMVVGSGALAMMMMMAMVVIVAMIVVVMRATMVRVTMVRVIMMRVIMMRVIMMRVIVIARRHRGVDGGGTVERMQQRQERTPLHPQQS